MRTKPTITAAALALACAACSGQDPEPESVDTVEQRIDLRANEFQGRVTFANGGASAAALTSLLGSQPCAVGVNSTSVGGLGASTEWLMPAPPPALTWDYVLSAPAEPTPGDTTTGVEYTLSATCGGWGPDQRIYYGFEPEPNHWLFARPAPAVTVDLEDCVGVYDIVWRTDCTDADLDGRGDGAFRLVKEAEINTPDCSARMHDFVELDTLTFVARAGNVVDTQVYYSTGSSWDWDQLRFAADVQLTAACDEVREICIPLPVIDGPCPEGGCPVTELTGPYDVHGETENVIRHVSADTGPNGNHRFQQRTVAPFEALLGNLSDYWLLPNMMPGQYQDVWLQGAIRTGYDFTLFHTPSFPLYVPAGVRTTTHAFDMRPGRLQGAIELRNPALRSAPGGDSWPYLFRQADVDLAPADGIPDAQTPDGGSHLHAGTHPWGWSKVSFAGAFDYPTGALVSSYEQLLPAPWDLTHDWSQNLTLVFNSTYPVAHSGQYVVGHVGMQPASATRTVASLSTHTIDHRACFSEVAVPFHLVSGQTMYGPQVDFAGSYAGMFQSSTTELFAVEYTAGGTFWGTPNEWSLAGTSGTVRMNLPQGEYTMTPRTHVIAGGVDAFASFPSFDLYVGCGQDITTDPELVVNVVLGDPPCATTAGAPIAISTQAIGYPPERIWYTVNGGLEHELCSGDCSAQDVFERVIDRAELTECDNQVVVRATRGESQPTTVSYVVNAEHCPAGDLRCPRVDTTAACVQGSEWVTLGDRSRVDATLATSSLTVGVEAVVQGPVEVAGDVSLAPNAVIGSDLWLSGTLTGQPGSRVVGDLHSGATVVINAIPTHSFSVGTGFQNVAGGTTQTLAPGDYGSMEVQSGATVTLGAGTYNFAQLVFRPDVTVVLDATSGPIHVNVAGHLEVYSRTTFVAHGATNPADVTFYAGGNVQIEPQVSFVGSIVAPAAHVRIAPSISIHGCVAARTVQVEPDSVITGVSPSTAAYCGDGVISGSETCDDGNFVDTDACPNTCQSPSCTDGVYQSGLETDVDCGGTCPNPCADGQGCLADGDCAGGSCVGGVCQPPPGGNLTASVSVYTDWGTGYCANAYVTNAGTTAATSWTVLLQTPNATITNLWNGTLTAGSPTHTVRSPSWAGPLAPGAVASFGFCATASAPSHTPVVISASTP